MAKRNSVPSFFSGVLGCTLILALLSLGGFALEYDIEKLAPLFNGGVPVDVPLNFWTFLIGALVSKIVVPVALIVIILSMAGLV